MVERLSLRLGPSRRLAAMLAGSHALAAGALWLAPLPLFSTLGCSLAIGAHLLWALRLHAWRTSANALIHLELLDDCSVSVSSRAGPWEFYRISGSSLASLPLVILSLRPGMGWRTRWVPIASDSLDPDTFRRLRVWLRWHWREGENGGAAQNQPLGEKRQAASVN